jgi:hypothetical protein
MLAALLEWFLWLAAFLYCLVKCFQKAENVSVKILSIVMMILFTALRYDICQTLAKETTNAAQSYLPPNHGCYSAVAGTSDQILSPRNG